MSSRLTIVRRDVCRPQEPDTLVSSPCSWRKSLVSPVVLGCAAFLLAFLILPVYRLIRYLFGYEPCDTTGDGYDGTEVGPIEEATADMRAARGQLSGDLERTLGRRSANIASEVAGLCRARLGLGRETQPSDPATRELVTKTCLGILTSKDYPDLRVNDALRILPHAYNLSLVPTVHEIDAMSIFVHPSTVANVRALRGPWFRTTTGWVDWFWSLFQSPVIPAVTGRVDF